MTDAPAGAVRRKADRPRTIGGPPTGVALTLLPNSERVNGWYEYRRPQGTLNERVRATMWGFRTYIQDDRIVTEAIVLPRDPNSSFGFVPIANFVIPEARTVRSGPAPDADLDHPY